MEQNVKKSKKELHATEREKVENEARWEDGVSVKTVAALKK